MLSEIAGKEFESIASYGETTSWFPRTKKPHKCKLRLKEKTMLDNESRLDFVIFERRMLRASCRIEASRNRRSESYVIEY